MTNPPGCTNSGADDRYDHPRRAKQKNPPAEKVTGTQSIQRAIDILHEIASCADTEGLRLSDLCTRTGLERPTAYRILTCLEENQMLVRAPQSRSYQLGPSIFHLGLAATQHNSLSNTCAFALDSLAAEPNAAQHDIGAK